MFDPKVYCEACRELKAPEDKIEEIIKQARNIFQKNKAKGKNNNRIIKGSKPSRQNLPNNNKIKHFSD